MKFKLAKGLYVIPTFVRENQKNCEFNPILSYVANVSQGNIGKHCLKDSIVEKYKQFCNRKVYFLNEKKSLMVFSVSWMSQKRINEVEGRSMTIT